MLIYKILNLINGKLYIGQTSKTLKYRWSLHVRSNKNSRYLTNAIKKYGPLNFSIEQIDTATSQEELNEKEKYWICFYKSTDRNIGYNIQPGGYKGKHSEETKKILSKMKLGKLNPMYGKSPSKETTLKRIQAITGLKRSKETIEKIKLANVQKIAIKCHQNGKTYTSISEAGRDLNIKTGAICRVIKGNRSHVHGYTFEYIDRPTIYKKLLTSEEKSEILKNRKIIKLPILCVTNNIIYKTVTEAAKALNLCNSSISDVLRGKNKTAGGHIFKYIN